jgi:hypothetical protein
MDELFLKHRNFPVIKGFLNDIILEERNTFDDFKALYVFGHCLNGKELILGLLVFDFVIRDSSQRYSKMFVKISLLIIDDVKTIRFFGPVHVAKLFVKIGIRL